jgi:hypothetical protein
LYLMTMSVLDLRSRLAILQPTSHQMVALCSGSKDRQ